MFYIFVNTIYNNILIVRYIYVIFMLCILCFIYFIFFIFDLIVHNPNPNPNPDLNLNLNPNPLIVGILYIIGCCFVLFCFLIYIICIIR